MKPATDPKELADLIQRADKLMLRLGEHNAFHSLSEADTDQIVEALRNII